jgi:NADH:ubiquinone oxidoreductase subunit
VLTGLLTLSRNPARKSGSPAAMARSFLPAASLAALLATFALAAPAQAQFGNRYYRTKGGKIDPALGFERRWVTYEGVAEASTVPPSWHGWLHHTVDTPPTEENYQPRDWQKPHRPNMTGTPSAYRPSGSTLASGRRPKATGDYEAWTPGQ